MADTTFTDGATPIVADWLNDVNNAVYPLSGMATKILDIGDWDMTTDASTVVSHGLDSRKIRTVIASIRDDDAGDTYDLITIDTSETTPYGIRWDALEISLFRGQGGVFDTVAFDSTSYNRGWVTIQYER